MVQQTARAILENGALRLLSPLSGIPEGRPLRIIVNVENPTHPLADCFGVLSDEDAREMRVAIDSEFEKVNPDEWK
jgi:hypothetical protein